MEYLSYWDSIINIGALKQLTSSPNSKQSMVLPMAATHSLKGMWVQLFTILKRVEKVSLNIIYFVTGLGYFVMNNPLSGTAQTFLVLDLSQRQLDQIYTAMPPADSPVRSILLEEQRPNLEFRNSNVDRVLLAPLKYKLLSLQLIGQVLDPWNRLPSQQGKQALVQFQKFGLTVWLELRIPYVSRSYVSGQSFELPSSFFDLLQQLQSVVERVVPQQYPLPEKKIKVLSTVPLDTKTTAGVPSRHLAPESRLREYFVNDYDADTNEPRAERITTRDIRIIEDINNRMITIEIMPDLKNRQYF